MALALSIRLTRVNPFSVSGNPRQIPALPSPVGQVASKVHAERWLGHPCSRTPGEGGTAWGIGNL